MGNSFKYTRRGEGSYDVQAVTGSGHAGLGRVHRSRGTTGTSWNGEYDHGSGWKNAGTFRSRDDAAQALLNLHEDRWGPLDGDGSKTPRAAAESEATPPAEIWRAATPPQERYAVIEDRIELRDLINSLADALQHGRSVRFTVHHGLKYDAGSGWTPSKGRPADETGR